MTRPINISELVAMLAGRAEALAAELLPGGRREGAEWVEAATSKGGLGDSLKVHLTGPKAGVWSHFAAGRSGDALDLVAYLNFAGDKGRAVAWTRRWLGLDTRDTAEIEQARREIGARQATAAAKAAEDLDRRRRQALGIWLGAEEKLAGTPAEAYLASRGINLGALGRQPRALRTHPKLWNVESRRHWPALVAGISGPDGKIRAVHRTWLDRASKAPLEHAKMTLGGFAGGCIRIWRGVTSDGKRAPALSAAPAGSDVTLTEGIEDALTVALAMPERRVLCAVSLANMAALELPEAIAEVTLCADNDAKGSPAAAALDRAIQRFLRQGRRVVLVRPPEGVKDINALLTREQRTGIR